MLIAKLDAGLPLHYVRVVGACRVTQGEVELDTGLPSGLPLHHGRVVGACRVTQGEVAATAATIAW